LASHNWKALTPRALAERASGKRLSSGAVSDYWLKKSWDYIRAEPTQWLRLLAKKWLMVWNAREVEGLGRFLYLSPMVLVTGVSKLDQSFWRAGSSGSRGAWLSRNEWRRLWLLYAMIVSFALSVAVFYVFGRYRFPLVPLLALFGRQGTSRNAGLVSQARMARTVCVFFVLLISAAFVNWPIYAFSGPDAAGYNNLSNAYYKQAGR